MISLRWSWAKGEGSIKPRESFLQADYITKLDAIQDWIHDLEQLYNNTMIEEHKKSEAKRMEKNI